MKNIHFNAVRPEVCSHSEVETVTSRMEILFAQHYEDNSEGNDHVLSIMVVSEYFPCIKYKAGKGKLSQFVR